MRAPRSQDHRVCAAQPGGEASAPANTQSQRPGELSLQEGVTPQREAARVARAASGGGERPLIVRLSHPRRLSQSGGVTAPRWVPCRDYISLEHSRRGFAHPPLPCLCVKGRRKKAVSEREGNAGGMFQHPASTLPARAAVAHLLRVPPRGCSETVLHLELPEPSPRSQCSSSASPRGGTPRRRENGIKPLPSRKGKASPRGVTPPRGRAQHRAV